MRFIISIVFTFLFAFAYTQGDTTFSERIKIIDAITVSFQSKTVYDHHNNYLLDFHVDSFGCYALLKNNNRYLLSQLDNRFQMRSTLSLPFKPLRLHRNCMQELYVIAKDSVYKVEEQLEEIEIYEPDHLDFYVGYFINCQLETRGHLVYKELFKSNKVARFYNIDKRDSQRQTFYHAYDPRNVELANEWEQVLRQDGIDPNANGQQLDIALILMKPEVFDRFTFYENIISQEVYNPIFSEDSTLLLFNQSNDSIIRFDTTHFEIKQQLPYSFHKIDGWKKQIFKDPVTQNYYTLFQRDGALYVASLARENFEILRSRKIDSDIMTKRFMVYDGFLYYDTKETMDSSFNKLMRQRL